MTRHYDMDPTTDAEVFEMLHGLFGIGDYNEDDDQPWHRFRITEISKIKAIRTRRRWAFSDFAMVARYCFTSGVRVTRAWDLLGHYGQAKAWDVANARLRAERRVDEAIAAERAADLPDSQEWINRLELSTGRGREEVLEAWMSARQRSLAGRN